MAKTRQQMTEGQIEEKAKKLVMDFFLNDRLLRDAFDVLYDTDIKPEEKTAIKDAVLSLIEKICLQHLKPSQTINLDEENNDG